MIDSLNMTHEEHFRLNGSLTAERIEALLETENAGEGLSEAVTYLEEARGGFPDEDFLSAVISKLQLLKSCKKSTKQDYIDAVEYCLEELEKVDEQVRQDAEYSEEQITKARNVLIGADV